MILRLTPKQRFLLGKMSTDQPIPVIDPDTKTE